MRYYLCAAAAALLPFVALADEPVKTKQSSIIAIGCDHCPPLKEKGKLPAYKAPELSGVVQETTIRDVDGVKQIERAEQWLGGAPVRYVSRSSFFMPSEAELMATTDSNIDKPNDGVDDATTTSAVEPAAPVEAQDLPLRQ